MTEEDLARIERAMASFPEGTGVYDLEVALHPGWMVTRRTLLRYLGVLIGSGRIIATGELKGRRYFPSEEVLAMASEAKRAQFPDNGTEPGGHADQLERIEAAAGLRRDFLVSYPDSGPYLGDVTRDHLHRLGGCAPGAKPAAAFLPRQIVDRLLIDLSWASSYLDGNTYSLAEVEQLLAVGEVPKDRTSRETLMILNHKEAIEFLVDGGDEIGFNSFSIRNLHAILSDSLVPDPGVNGRVRQLAADVGGCVYPLSTRQLLDEFFEATLATAAAITEPFEQAFFILVQLCFLQPFDQLNNAVARLAANLALIKKGLCPLSFIDLPAADFAVAVGAINEKRNLEPMRELFVSGYEHSVKRYLFTRTELGDPDPFRLKYRKLLTAAIQAVVLQGETLGEDAIIRFAAAEIPEDDRDAFISLLWKELRGLHEGNIARFRLRPADFQLWKENNVQRPLHFEKICSSPHEIVSETGESAAGVVNLVQKSQKALRKS